MVYSEEIEGRVQRIAARLKNTTSKNMFGGVCHLIDDKMFCGVHKDYLILRLGVEDSSSALEMPRDWSRFSLSW